MKSITKIGVENHDSVEDVGGTMDYTPSSELLQQAFVTHTHPAGEMDINNFKRFCVEYDLLSKFTWKADRHSWGNWCSDLMWSLSSPFTLTFLNSLNVGVSVQKTRDLDMSFIWSFMKRSASILTDTTQKDRQTWDNGWCDAIIIRIIHTHLMNSFYVDALV